jgi:hypothetical protein
LILPINSILCPIMCEIKPESSSRESSASFMQREERHDLLVLLNERLSTFFGKERTSKRHEQSRTELGFYPKIKYSAENPPCRSLKIDTFNLRDTRTNTFRRR